MNHWVCSRYINTHDKWQYINGITKYVKFMSISVQTAFQRLSVNRSKAQKLSITIGQSLEFVYHQPIQFKCDQVTGPRLRSIQYITQNIIYNCTLKSIIIYNTGKLIIHFIDY